MKVTETDRGFKIIKRPAYADEERLATLIKHSSEIGDYPDAFDRPGSSFLWVGADHHLGREEVADLVEHLKAWLETGSIVVEDKEEDDPVTVARDLSPPGDRIHELEGEVALTEARRILRELEPGGYGHTLLKGALGEGRRDEP